MKLTVLIKNIYVLMYRYIDIHTSYAEIFQINEGRVWAQWDTKSASGPCSLFSSISCNCAGLVCSPNSSKGVN